jgi:predicted transcriptional regulator
MKTTKEESERYNAILADLIDVCGYRQIDVANYLGWSLSRVSIRYNRMHRGTYLYDKSHRPGVTELGHTRLVKRNIDILIAYRAGENMRELARNLGIGKSAVYKVVELYNGIDFRAMENSL